MPLAPKRQRFVAEYLKDLNATQAAIRTGYSPRSAEVTGCRLLRDAKVSQAIAAGRERLGERAELSAAKVLEDLTRIARKAEEAEQFSPAAKCLELLGKHLAMFTDRTELAGAGGKAITISIEGIVR